jgi:hypothetical protein
MQKPDEEFSIDETQHWLYTGVTQTGKTTLARFHARELAKAKHKVYVYDPVMTETAGGEWEGCSLIRTDDTEKAIEQLEKLKDCYVFVDEAPDIFGHEHRDTHWMLRRKRHDGVYFRLIAQRPTMLPPSVRSQCARVWIFRLAMSDAKVICADWGHDASVCDEEFDTGDCLMLKAGSTETEFFNCFDLVPNS